MSLAPARDSWRRLASPSRTLSYLPGLALLLDGALILVASGLAALGRLHWDLFASSADVRGSLGWFWPFVVATWVVAIWLCGGYTRSLFDAGTDEFRRVARASLYAAGTIGVWSFLLKTDLSRGFFLLTFVLGTPLLLSGRLLLRRLVYTARGRGLLLHRVLIAGSPGSVDEVAAVLRREQRLGYRVVGALTPAATRPVTPSGIPVLGAHTDVVAKVEDTGADVVFFADGGVVSSAALRSIAWELDRVGTQVVMAPSVSDVSGERVRVRPVGGLPLIHLDPSRSTDASRWGKRAFDVAGAGVALALTWPLLLAAAVWVKLHDGGPVLFRQTRVGRDGRPFQVLKVRTMVVDAEARLQRLREECGYDGGLFKLKDDPRITAPGRLLRRLSIDELPQLLNVLRGDMSLIGPRPPLPLEAEQYDEVARRRLHVRPGITGLWQISGRSDLSWDEAIRLDLYYVDNWSMFQDLSILVRTVGAVLASRGAY